MPKDFDIVVVGAGPAGSAAAFTAVENGVSVLLVEEHPEIGIPLACAEGISRSTIKDYLVIKPEWIAQKLSGAIVRGPDNNGFRIYYPDVGWILNRKIFDPGLAKIAEQRGVVIKKSAKAIGVEDNSIIVNENNRTKRYKFRFLIGADGYSSYVGRWMGIDTRLRLDEVEVCAEYFMDNIEIDPEYAQLIFGNNYAPGGYAWIFPKSRHAANIGLGISPMKTKRRAKDFLDDWVKNEFPQGKVKERIFGGIPAKIMNRFSGKNFFLIGDAARFTDPLSGAGIANGIKSGVIAGRNAVLRMRGKKDYFEREIKKEILCEIKFHHRVRKAYLKLNEQDYNEIVKIGKKVFGGKTVSDINTHHLVKEILLSSPRLLRIGFNLFF